MLASQPVSQLAQKQSPKAANAELATSVRARNMKGPSPKKTVVAAMGYGGLYKAIIG